MAAPAASAPVYDVVGLGFGPANVAIAGAIVDKWASTRSGDATVSLLLSFLPARLLTDIARYRSIFCLSVPCSSAAGALHREAAGV